MNNIRIKVYEKLLKKYAKYMMEQKTSLVTELNRFALMKSYLLRG